MDSPIRKGYPHLKSPPYDWTFENTIGPDLDNVKLRWDVGRGRTAAAGAGSLRKGSTASDNEGFDPMPQRGTMHWRVLPDGPIQTQQIEIASRIPDAEKFEGTIYIVFNGKSWDVEAVPKSHQLSRMMETERKKRENR